MSAHFEQRLEILESRLAFQEHTLENLNQVVTRQDRELLELKQRLADLAARLKEIDAAGPATVSGSEHEIPPHY
ncbi:MAG TPA: SlyX family protein [Xanthomonadales bacterium]|nr:SlyX family protein [Xanthomonadales bacterium]